MIQGADIRHDRLPGSHFELAEDVLFGTSPAMRAVREVAEKLASATEPVLITGETGTGKEILAKYIHGRSSWAECPYFKLNCPLFRFSPVLEDPLAKSLAEMVSASGAELGQELPFRGTLLLDNIAFLDMVMQAKILERLNENPLLEMQLPQGQTLEVRLICTANRRLDRLVREGCFLRELYYLIRVFTVDLPPLRDRREDLAQLTTYFLDLYNRKFGTPRLPPSPLVFQRMREYSWPGNIRELENVIMQYVVQGSDSMIIRELSGHRGPPHFTGFLPR